MNIAKGVALLFLLSAVSRCQRAVPQEGGTARAEVSSLQSLYDACNEGDAAACYDAGFQLHAGRGVAQDRAMAAVYYDKACQGGNPAGCSNLGLLYTYGLGVPLDRAKGVALQERSCQSQFAQGCLKLAIAYDLGHGVAQDEAKAMRLFRRACELGDAAGCEWLHRRGASEK